MPKCCRVKSSQEHGSSCGIFRSVKRLKVLAIFDLQRAQLPATSITEQPTLLAKIEIKRRGYKFSVPIFAKNRAVISRTRSRPCPGI